MIRVSGAPVERASVTEKRGRVTEKPATVTEIAARRRGRPRKADALTPAAKQKAYRERKKRMRA